MNQPKKLIEVAMPIKEISAESVRDKSIRHGHISTLHLWWARRPLPVCRAVVFASLVPDPSDENCPQAFRDAVKILLKEHRGIDAYKPYDNIPYTAVVDPMEDNLRNRLLMFIGKFSDAYMNKGESTAAKDKLSDASLIKWDNKNDEEIIGKGRKLIWVAHNAKNGAKADDLLADFDKHYKAIKDAEKVLYMTADRHIESDDVRRKEANLKDAIEAFLDKMPRVFDPFAGGGAIPLEASRLGCRSFGNDINPVAHIIQKGSLEFPQKYGKPIVYSRVEFIKRYGEDELKRVSAENSLYAGGDKVKIKNRLSFDVEFYARKLLKRAEAEIGRFYPADDKGKKPIAYYWARVGTCSNPSCRAEVPLLKGFYLANTKNKQVYLKPIIEGNKIDFEIGKGKFDAEGWMTSRALICPICNNPTATSLIKTQAVSGNLKEKLIAVIEDSDKGKAYRVPTKKELQASTIDESLLNPQLIPNETMLKIPDLVSGRGWGIDKWSELFSPRQLLAMQTLVEKLNELKKEIGIESDYGKAIITYLGILVDRLSIINTSFGIWHTGRETLERPMGRQAVPMVFDYPESNLFCDSTGSASNQREWLTRYIESESNCPFSTILQNASSGEREQFPEKSITAVITDPPYCLTAGTLILTENGYRPIEEIKVGERVLSHEGRFVRVSHTFERDYDGDLWRVFMTGANRPLEITPEHPIYAMKTADCPFSFRYCRPTCSYLAQQGRCRHQQFENYKAEWICPTDLKAFDLIGFPILQTKTRPKNLSLSDFLDNGKYTLSADVLHYEKISLNTLAVRRRLAEVSGAGGSLASLARELDVPKQMVYRLSKTAPMQYTQNNSITVNADFMRLLGYFVADGYAHVRADGGTIQFTFGLHETAYGTEVGRLMWNIFGIQAGKTTDNRRQNNNSFRYNFYSKPVAEFLRRLCYAENGKKILPVWVLTLPDNLLWNFVETLWNGDGHRSKESYSLANVSPYLIGQTQIILHRLGLLTGYYHEQKERVSIINGNTAIGKQKFSLTVNGESLCRMAKKIGLPASNDISRQFTGQRGYSDGKMIWRPIRKIEKTEFRGKVYNLETEDHSYTTFAGCVHNCDAIAYADLSDFFYVWMKRTLGDVYPANFATPQTPKTEECTALKHHHEGDAKKAYQHFENKLLQIFEAIEHQTSDSVCIMYAHQSTEAWTTLCNSILGAGLNITGSWAVDSEMTGALKTAKAFLSSSVTVSCKPANRSGFGDYKQVKRAIEKKVEEEVAELYGLGFRGADLLTACFGKAVGEFGKYERVEKASGDEVTVAELLEMTRESAFNALLKGFKGDDFTKFYIGWLELYGFTESDFDDAAKFSRVGLSINVADLFTHDIFIKNGNKQSLAGYTHRNEKIKRLGENAGSALIDQAHRAMSLYKNGDRRVLLDFIGKVASSPDASFWRVLTSLDELLPKGIDDHRQAAGLLENKDNLIRESQTARDAAEQGKLYE